MAKATQVKHILGAAAQAARALELADDDAAVGKRHILFMRALAAPPRLVDIPHRYPTAPPHGGRVGQLMHALDAALR